MPAWVGGAASVNAASTIGANQSRLSSDYVKAENMTHLYREFHLKDMNVWNVFVAFVGQNAKKMAEAGKPLRLIVTASDTKRNNEQNKRYWGFVLRTIADQAWVDGQQYNTDTWHEYFARKFGVCEDMKLPGGEIITRRKSTTEMTVSDFTEYMTHVESYATQELGVKFEAQI